jgi:hypothetical protein
VPDKLTPPQKSLGDTSHEAAKGIADLATYGAGGRLFDYLIKKPIERRRDEWREEVGNRIRQLEAKKGLDLEALANDERFVSLATQASAAAVRTHLKQKRDALRNAVLNLALGISTDETLEQIFTNSINDLTPLHLQVLDSCRVNNFRPGRFKEILALFPDVRERGLGPIIENDLATRGFIKPDKTSGVTELIPNERWITHLGEAFLDFIHDPLEPESHD